MLDDLRFIHNRDPRDTLGVPGRMLLFLESEPIIEAAFGESDILNIVVVSLDATRTAAHALLAWPGCRLPIEIVESAKLPAYIGEKTLVVLLSQEGNEPELIGTAKQAKELGAHIIAITHGGLLGDFSISHGMPLIKLPDALTPYFGFYPAFKALVALLDAAEVLPTHTTELAEVTSFLQTVVRPFAPETPTTKNQAKQLALECLGKSVVISSSTLLYPAALRFQSGLHENAKSLAWIEQFPIFAYGDGLAWTGHPEQRPYTIIELLSSLDDSGAQTAANRVLSGLRPHAHIVTLQGENTLEQLLWAMLLGDFVSLYLSVLLEQDPTDRVRLRKLNRGE